MVNLPLFYGSSPLNFLSPSRDDTSTSDFSPESILKDCQTKQSKNAQPKAKTARTQLTKFAKKISQGLVNKGIWRENCFHCTTVQVQQSTTKLHGVAERVQHHTTSRKTKEFVVLYNICSVKKFDRDQTSYNKILYDTTRWPNECNISYNIKVVSGEPKKVCTFLSRGFMSGFSLSGYPKAGYQIH